MQVNWKFPVIDYLARTLEGLNPLVPHDRTEPVGVDEFHARWYLTPHWHAAEIVGSFFILGPLLVHTYKVMARELRELNIDYKPSTRQAWWSFGLLMSFLLQVPLKLDTTNMPSHPAFMLQPCHVSAVLYFLASMIPSQTSFVMVHSISLLTWGPSLAFCFPNFPATQYEVVFFWLQHVFLVTAPFFASDQAHRKLYRSWHWNWFPWVLLLAYHWWTLLPWSVWTGVNVATMLIPPPALISFKKYYRLVQAVSTFIMHNMSIFVHRQICELRVKYYDKESAPTINNGHSNGKKHH